MVRIETSSREGMVLSWCKFGGDPDNRARARGCENERALCEVNKVMRRLKRFFPGPQGRGLWEENGRSPGHSEWEKGA